MKKVYIILLAIFVLALSACGEKNQTQNQLKPNIQVDKSVNDIKKEIKKENKNMMTYCVIKDKKMNMEYTFYVYDNPQNPMVYVYSKNNKLNQYMLRVWKDGKMCIEGTNDETKCIPDGKNKAMLENLKAEYKMLTSLKNLYNADCKKIKFDASKFTK